MNTYSDDPNVQALVKAVERFIRCSGLVDNSRWKDDLNSVLTPFQPDPEEELIEAMVEAHDKPLHYHKLPANEDYDKVRMRAALDVVKERGLPK